TAGLIFWGNGSVIQNGWSSLRVGGPTILAAATGLVLIAPSLDILSLGDDTAVALGQRVAHVRRNTVVLSILLIAAGVVIAGPIGFVGLVAPNLVRLAGVRQHRQ